MTQTDQPKEADANARGLPAEASPGKDMTGLSSEEAARRLVTAGPNRIAKPREVSFLGIALEEIKEPMILLLLVVGFFYAIWGKLEDALTIVAIIVLLVLAEVWNEFRAKKAIAALSKIAAPRTRVLRDGQVNEVDTEKVVPGDTLVLGQGTRVPADARLLVSYSLQVDESPLTGESFPQDRQAGDEIYGGTIVASGEGTAEVTATGLRARIGQLSAKAREIKEPKTPLQKSMKSLATNLVWIAIFFSVLIPLIGLLRGQPLKEMILTGLALSFAVIPEELPIIITMVLGLGAYQLSRQNFLVKKIRAAEVLGNATVILSDKTGTITENVMRVAAVYPPADAHRVLSAASCALTELSLTPTDRAIAGECQRQNATCAGRVARERSFNSTRKTKAVLREMTGGGLELFTVGAPEEVLKLCGPPVAGLEDAIRGETGKGRRVIAIARREIPAESGGLPFEALEYGMDVVGAISIEDTPREGVRETIAKAREAGIRTIMVTGDHPLTATYIAGSVGIDNRRVLTGEELDRMPDAELMQAVRDVSVFARTTPEHKYRLVKVLREDGEVVAVTGDGINDSLALKGADIGISMGIKGTDVAKEAADVILADDNFVTISRGIFEGRKFFDNLKKGLRYYLSVKTALVLVFLVPVIVGLPLPFAPIQIILLELFMDLAASAGFVAEPAERSIYKVAPRGQRERIFDARMIRGIAWSGISLFAAVMIVYGYALSQGVPVMRAQTMAFATWVVGHIFLAFVSRSEQEPLISLGPFSNRVMDIWAVAAFAFLAIAVGVPFIGANLKLTTLTAGEMAVIIAVALITIGWMEMLKLLGMKDGDRRL